MSKVAGSDVASIGCRIRRKRRVAIGQEALIYEAERDDDVPSLGLMVTINGNNHGCVTSGCGEMAWNRNSVGGRRPSWFGCFCLWKMSVWVNAYLPYFIGQISCKKSALAKNMDYLDVIYHI